MDKLDKDKILENLPEKRLNISIFDEIDSTNDEAKRIDLSKEFQVLVANKQTNGRGRQGKKWLSPDSGNIYMTICTENDLSFAPASLIAGLVCINSISQLNDFIELGLKWPNDILMENKKIGGILVEKEFINENPEIWTPKLKKELYEACRTIIEHEDAFIDLAFEMGPMEGLTAQEVKDYIRFIANRRLSQLGLEPIYDVQKNPLTWLDTMLNAVEHMNFFEGRATEYSKASTQGTWGRSI